MKILIFGVFDKKTAAFMAPFFQLTRGQALRTFVDSLEQPDGIIGKHPEDFSLMELGSFDDNSGMVEGRDVPDFVANASDFREIGNGNLRSVQPSSGRVLANSLESSE